MGRVRGARGVANELECGCLRESWRGTTWAVRSGFGTTERDRRRTTGSCQSSRLAI